MNFLKKSLARTNDQLKLQSPLVQIFAGLMAGTMCGCLLLHLGKSILYALGLTLLFFELGSDTETTNEDSDWNIANYTLDIHPYVNEMKRVFATQESLAISFVSGCLIGTSIGAT